MIEVNLLPWRNEARNQQRKNKFIYYILCISMPLFVLYICHLFLSHNLNIKQAVYQNKINQISHQSSNEDENRNFFIKNELKHQYFLIDLFNQLVQLKNKIYISDLMIHKKMATIQGAAESIAEVKYFMETLTANKHIDFVKLISLQVTENNIKFNLQLMER